MRKCSVCACASCKESMQHARRGVGGHLVVFSASLSFTIWCAPLCEWRILDPVHLVCSLLTCPLCPWLGTNRDVSAEVALCPLLELGRKSTIHLEKCYNSEAGSSFLALHIYNESYRVSVCMYIMYRNTLLYCIFEIFLVVRIFEFNLRRCALVL